MASSPPPQLPPERIWYRDMPGFVRDDRVARILPEAGTTLASQLNAIVRFSLVFAVTAFVFQRSAAALYVPAGAALLTFLIYESESRAGREGVTVAAAAGAAPQAAAAQPQAPCTRPTRSNPFMNVLVSGAPERGEACDVFDDPDAARDAEKMFQHNLYRDADDVFNRNTSSRTFYTTASTTVPNDQTTFAKWLYRAPGRTCKEGSGEACNILQERYPPGR